MFKFQAIRRFFAYALLSVYVLSIPMTANAMYPGKDGGSSSGGGGGQQQAILTLQALLLLLQNGPGLLNQVAQAAPELVGQVAQYFVPVALPPAPQPVQQPLAATPVRPAAVPRPTMPTPQGHGRIFPGHDFFATPRTAGSRGVYVHTQDPIAFEPIDINNEPLTEDEAYALLEQHPNREALLDLLPPPCPDFRRDASPERREKYRYAGKTKNPMQERFSEEIRAARNKDDRPSRHYQGLRGGYVRFGRAIFINTREVDNWDIERALIRFIRANWGLGLNSNGGSKSKKRGLEPDFCIPETDVEEEDAFAFLSDDCRDVKSLRRNDDLGDDDDEEDGGSSSDSTAFSPSGSQQGSGTLEVF